MVASEKLAYEWTFQTLIGTVKTLLEAEEAPKAKARFQTLIGTVKTYAGNSLSKTVNLPFQTLIGTVKTRPTVA